MSIGDRPKVVGDQSRRGDWEIDTVIDKDYSGALVIIVERVTAQVNGKSAKEVTQMEVGGAVRRLNPRPRKGLEYKTPSQLLNDHRVALAA